MKPALCHSWQRPGPAPDPGSGCEPDSAGGTSSSAGWGRVHLLDSQDAPGLTLVGGGGGRGQGTHRCSVSLEDTCSLLLCCAKLQKQASEHKVGSLFSVSIDGTKTKLYRLFPNKLQAHDGGRAEGREPPLAAVAGYFLAVCILRQTCCSLIKVGGRSCWINPCSMGRAAPSNHSAAVLLLLLLLYRHVGLLVSYLLLNGHFYAQTVSERIKHVGAQAVL